MRGSLEERFWAKVDRRDGDECWPWRGAIGGEGYGHIRGGGKTLVASRVAYELNVGRIPPGLEIDHLCRNRSCVNPAHLEPVTKRENILRGEGRGAQQARQTHCLRGHPLSGENLYVDPRGKRNCRECTRQAHRRQRARRAAA